MTSFKDYMKATQTYGGGYPEERTRYQVLINAPVEEHVANFIFI